MSLIRVRNFTAPFRSKVQIAAIVIVGLLVAAVRMVGGGISGEIDVRRDRKERSVETQSESRNIRELLDSQPRKADRRRGETEDDMLKGLMDGSFERERQKQREAEHKASEFDDIRRSLGLE